jgi:hypothetical protein
VAAHRGGERLEHANQAQPKHLKRDHAGHGDERGDQPYSIAVAPFSFLSSVLRRIILVLSLAAEARGGGVERVLMGGEPYLFCAGYLIWCWGGAI